MRRLTLSAFVLLATTVGALARAPPRAVRLVPSAAAAPSSTAAGRPAVQFRFPGWRYGARQAYTAASRGAGGRRTSAFGPTLPLCRTQSFVLIVHDVDVVMEPAAWATAPRPGRLQHSRDRHFAGGRACTSDADAARMIPIQMAAVPDAAAPRHGGPASPSPRRRGFVHHCNFDLYALDIKLPLDAGASRGSSRRRWMPMSCAGRGAPSHAEPASNVEATSGMLPACAGHSLAVRGDCMRIAAALAAACSCSRHRRFGARRHPPLPLPTARRHWC